MNKKCIRCGRKKKPYAKGLCHSCWVYAWIKKDKKRYKKALEKSRKWSKANPEYYRNYQRKLKNILKSQWRKE